MRIQWRLVLPIVGLALFAAETNTSLGFNHKVERAPSRYFYWAGIRLDSDPLNRRPPAPTTTACKEGPENCVTWELRSVWIDPGLLAQGLEYSALPAFILGGFVTIGLGRLGINEIWTFMLTMPVLVFAWYYFVGWLIDRWTRKRLHAVQGEGAR